MYIYMALYLGPFHFNPSIMFVVTPFRQKFDMFQDTYKFYNFHPNVDDIGG